MIILKGGLLFMKYDHTIIHEGKECNAVEVIKEQDLNQSVYYTRRKEGMSAQEAFLYCWNLKHHVTIEQFTKESKISKKAIYRGINKKMSLEEIKGNLKRKREKEFQTLEYLRKIGLPLEYNSLTDFCNREQLNLGVVHYGIQEGMNLYEAVQQSFAINFRGNTNMYLNIQLKAIAQKYKLDSNRLNFWLRKGFSYQEAIEKDVFARIFSVFNYSGVKYANLWKIYKNAFLEGVNIQDKVMDRELESFVVSYNRMEHIKRDLRYYAFLEGVGIAAYQLLSLDERVQNVLLTDPNISYTLSELYYILDFEHGLMSDFTYVLPYQVWVYNGNREVLKKLKKPSN